MTISAKTRHVHTTTEFNFIIPAYRCAQYLSIPSVSNVKCLLVCFPGGHFADPPKSQLEQWHQLPGGSGDLGLLPLTLWALPHWPLCGHHGCSWGVPNRGLYCLPTHPIPPSPILTLEKNGKNIIKFSHQWFRSLATIKAN